MVKNVADGSTRSRRLLKVSFIDSGREPKCPPNPAYPNGQNIDLALGARTTCSVDLPYPAPRCGLMIVECETCRKRIALTVAGRVDDPRSVKIACERKATEMEKYPRGKLSDDDEGAVRIAIGVRDKTLVIDFGKDLSWIGMGKAEAIEFANAIIKRAEEL